MSNVTVISTLQRGGSAISPFPITLESDVASSYLTVADLTARNAIPAWKRLPFMRVYVVGTGLDYRLGSDITIAGQVWSLITTGAGTYQLLSEKNQPSGYVGLTPAGKIDPSFIDNIYANNSYVVVDNTARNALTTLTGDIIVVTSTSKIYVKLNNNPPVNINADFAELLFPGVVISVNGMTGSVSITIANLLATPSNLTDFNTAVGNAPSVLALNAVTATHSSQISTNASNILSVQNYAENHLGLADLSAIAKNPTGAQIGYSLVWNGTNYSLQLIGGGGGATSFLGLSDTPHTYVGQTLKGVRVNAAETALEFYTITGGLSTASNGLTVVGSDVQLGGDILTTNIVTVRPRNSAQLNLMNWYNNTTEFGRLRIGSSSDGSGFERYFDFNTGDPITYTDNVDGRGILYSANYSATFTARSLVDKGYVDGLTGATGAWKLASGGTLTGINTIVLGSTNDINFNGTTANLILGTTVVASSTGTQANSLAQSFKSSLWTGAVATPGWFTWRDTASTTNNQLHVMTLYSSTGASPSFGTKQFEIYSNGSTVIGTGLYFSNVVPGSATGQAVDVSGSDWYFRNYVSGKSIFIGNGVSGILSTFFSTGELSIASSTKAAALYVVQANLSSAWIPTIKFIPGTHTAQTAATEFPDMVFGGATGDANTAVSTRTSTWLAGTVATQRSNYFRGTILTGASSTATFTNAYTVYIDPPVVGTNAAITTNWALGLNGNMTILPTNGRIIIGNNSTGMQGDGSFLYIGGITGGNGWTTRIVDNANSITIASFGQSATQGQRAGFGSTTLTNANWYFTQPAQTTTGAVPLMRYDGGAHTNITAAETLDINYNLNRTVQFTGNTGFGTQRAIFMQGVTYAFVSATGTIADAYTLYVGTPLVGTNAAINNPWAIGTSGNVQVAPSVNGAAILNVYNTNTGTSAFSQLKMQSNGSSFTLASYPSNYTSGGFQNSAVIQLTSGMRFYMYTSGGNVALYGENNTGNFRVGDGFGASNAKFAVFGTPLSSAWLPTFRMDYGADTAKTAATEFPDAIYGGATTDVSTAVSTRTSTWLAGTVATQRSNYFRGTVLTGASATATFTNAYTVYIDAATAGTNAAITNSWALGLNGSARIVGDIQFTKGSPAFIFTSDAFMLRFGTAGSQRLSIEGAGANAGQTTFLNSPTSGSLSWINFTQSVNTSGSPTIFTLTGAAHTTLGASVEAIDVNFNLNRTVQFATGALATQRAFVIQAPTYGFVGSSTITNAATVAITGSPVVGTNAIITNSYALWIQGGNTLMQGNLAITSNSGTPFITTTAASSTFSIDGNGVWTGIFTTPANLMRATYTATNTNQSVWSYDGTLTARATASDTMYYFTVSPSMLAGATTQDLRLFRMIHTFNANSQTGLTVYGIDYNPTITGTLTHIAARFTSGQFLIGGTTITNASTLLDLQSTTQALAVPRMTTAQITAIVTKSVGMVVYDTTLNQLQFYNNSAFTSVGGSGITNSAVNTELMMSNGTNAVSSSLLVPSQGNLTMGAAGLAGATRTILAGGSAADVGIVIQSKGGGGVNLTAGSTAINVNSGSGIVAIGGTAFSNYITLLGSTIQNSGSAFAAFSIIGASGISGFTTGANLVLSSGDGYSTGTTNAGNVNIASGIPNSGGTEGSINIQTRTTGKLGFFNVSGVVQQSVNTILVNNVTSGGTVSIIADFTSLTVYATDAATIRNNFYRLTEKVLKLETALRNYGIVIN